MVPIRALTIMSLQMNNDGDGEKGRVCPILPADDVGVYIRKTWL
jgi:hypothetical protein